MSEIKTKLDRLEQELKNGPKIGGMADQMLHAVIIPQLRASAKSDAGKFKEAVKHIVQTLTEIFEL